MKKTYRGEKNGLDEKKKNGCEKKILIAAKRRVKITVFYSPKRGKVQG
jgi:hypothetical protein